MGRQAARGTYRRGCLLKNLSIFNGVKFARSLRARAASSASPTSLAGAKCSWASGEPSQSVEASQPTQLGAVRRDCNATTHISSLPRRGLGELTAQLCHWHQASWPGAHGQSTRWASSAELRDCVSSLSRSAPPRLPEARQLGPPSDAHRQRRTARRAKPCAFVCRPASQPGRQAAQFAHSNIVHNSLASSSTRSPIETRAHLLHNNNNARRRRRRRRQPRHTHTHEANFQQRISYPTSVYVRQTLTNSLAM